MALEINLLKEGREVEEELLVLLKLKVENNFLEVEVDEATLVLLDQLQNLIPRQLTARRRLLVQLPLV